MLNAKKLRDPAIWQTDLDTLMTRVSDHYAVDEENFVNELIKLLNADRDDFARIEANTAALVRDVRKMDTAVVTIDELLQQDSLDTHGGLILMCQAEAMRGGVPSTSPIADKSARHGGAIVIASADSISVRT